MYYSGYAAANIGHKIAVLPKADAEVDLKEAFAKAPPPRSTLWSAETSFVTKNVYHTADRERRTSTVSSVIDPYRTDEVPAIDAAIWHLAGLVGGDIPNEMIPFAAQHAWWPSTSSACCAGWRTAAWSITTGQRKRSCCRMSDFSRPTRRRRRF